MSQQSPRSARFSLIPAPLLRGTRWDPAFWRPRGDELPGPSAPLGDFIERITYGPIVTGKRPQHVATGVTIVDQKVIRPTGILLAQAVRVAEGCEYDLPRCRLRPGDIVLARSGAGTLGRKRFTVFAHRAKATVSCFVDLVRLRGISPWTVVTFLRSRFGWPQIERLTNGVGTPNLSFGEIRSLRVPLLPAADQEEIEGAWREVRKLHAAKHFGEAEAALDRIVARLEARLDGMRGAGRGPIPGRQDVHHPPCEGP